MKSTSGNNLAGVDAKLVCPPLNSRGAQCPCLMVRMGLSDGSCTHAVPGFFQPTGWMVDGMVFAHPWPCKVWPSMGIRQLDGYQVSSGLEPNHHPLVAMQLTSRDSPSLLTLPLPTLKIIFTGCIAAVSLKIRLPSPLLLGMVVLF